MAKKKAISYSPNTALIQGARDVAQSEALMNMAGTAAFTESLTSGVQEIIKKQEEINSTRDAYLADLGSIQNINLLDEDYNKQAVTNFVRTKRDEYSKLAEAYAKTKNIDILDKMDTIKFSFQNLNTQLKGLVNERKEYLDSYDKGQIVDIPELGDEKYAYIYTNKGSFNVEDNGDIGFSNQGKYEKFKDIAGKWNVKNNINETFILKQNLTATQRGEAGKNFYRNDIKNLYISSFKQTGPEGLMVMAKTDLTGDDQYVIGKDKDGNDILSGNQSFESMWSQGLLDEKFYKKFSKENGASWMYDKKNTNILNDLMSEYYTDVTNFSFDIGSKNYKGKDTKQGGLPNYLETSFGSKNKIRANKFVNDVKNKKKKIRDLNGNEFIYQPLSKVYKSILKNKAGKSITRTPAEMIESNEMDAYYSNIYQELLEIPEETTSDFIDFKDFEKQNTFGKDNLSPTDD
jgi:hypothetical protein